MEKIRYAVMADIHGNYEAFTACLDYALMRGIEKFIFLGDYLGEFPDPQKTLKLLYELRDEYECYFVKGNKEDYWLDRKYNPDCVWKNGNASVGAMKYVYENLTDEDFTFFESLPVAMTINKRGYKPIIACHGTPASNKNKLLPNDEATMKFIENDKDALILCGHSHIQMKIETDNEYALNPGSVGIALETASKVTQFMILEGDENGYTHEFISLTYDVEKEVASIKASKVYEVAPHWSRISINVLRNGEPSNLTVLMSAIERDAGAHEWYEIPDKVWEETLESFGIE